MYRKFQLQNIDEHMFVNNIAYYRKSGQNVVKGKTERISGVLQSVIIGNAYALDGQRIQEEWFPEVKCDIFISHSHKNKDLAICIAGWLHEKFGLQAFIDSEIWDNAENLLKEIDDHFCKIPGKHLYNYKQRNQSTSHVYLMLNMALAQMIDNTECLFFLNTPESVNLKDIRGESTLSPWIFSEIGLSNLLRSNIPDRFGETRKFAKGGDVKRITESQDLSMTHRIETSDFVQLNNMSLHKWATTCSEQGTAALDNLYKTFPVASK